MPPRPFWRQVCARCGTVSPVERAGWRCACGGLWDLVGPLVDPFGPGGHSVALPAPPVASAPGAPPGSPGTEGEASGTRATRLVEAPGGVLVKCEYEHPTGSFKDRGAAAMVGLARALGVRSAVIDSSGNAGLAVAAACATAGIDLKVFLPAGTDRSKVEAISGFGATVVEVAGPREAAAGAARHEVGEDPGAPGHDETFPWYASHVHQPAFHHGVKTLAYELFEQMGEDLEGATIVAPAGNGTLVLGLWIGTGELVALGRLARRPRLVAVQAERCAPIASLPVTGLPTMASGIAIASPPRLGQIRGAVAATGGRVVTVTEESVSRAVSELLDMGIPVQPTGAVGWAAATSSTVAATGPVVVLATGGAAPH